MLNFSFSELLLIAVVAVVCLGPKELPVVVRTVARGLLQLRALTAEMRAAFHGLAREAGLDDLHQDIRRDVRKITLGDDGKPYEAYDLDTFLKSTPSVSPADHDKPSGPPVGK